MNPFGKKAPLGIGYTQTTTTSGDSYIYDADFAMGVGNAVFMPKASEGGETNADQTWALGSQTYPYIPIRKLSKEEQIVQRIQRTICKVCGKEREEMEYDTPISSVLGKHFICENCTVELTSRLFDSIMEKLVGMKRGNFCKDCNANVKACTCKKTIILEKLST